MNSLLVLVVTVIVVTTNHLLNADFALPTRSPLAGTTTAASAALAGCPIMLAKYDGQAGKWANEQLASGCLGRWLRCRQLEKRDSKSSSPMKRQKPLTLSSSGLLASEPANKPPNEELYG